ncbi:hypothetical protein [Desulfitibacter alkalitolerans]|uniref:hypothetical protein n=1 Tax=Desulfitibacter alkalitolerans TaxID=264641 RepID=UPI00047F6A0C|nr:hypothetical protein [Desulfitibacter alkalitolerans]
MGINPEDVEYLSLAKEAKIGFMESSEIINKGVKIEEVKTTFAHGYGKGFNQLFPEINIMEGGACSGCVSNLYLTLKQLKDRGTLKKLPNITLIIGKDEKRYETSEKVLFIGNCTMAASVNLFLPGCPILPSELIQLLENLVKTKLRN